jgi:hypothetical protein
MPDVQNYFIGYVHYPHKDWKHGSLRANVSSVFFAITLFLSQRENKKIFFRRTSYAFIMPREKFWGPLVLIKF